MTKELSWRITLVEGQATEWYPALEIGTSGVALGVSREGGWLVGDDNECIRVGSTSTGVRLLPLLERDPEPTRAAIEEFVKNCEVSVEGGPDFPVHVAVREALTGRAKYWADLALTWLGVVDPPPEILTSLEKAMSEPWASQRFKH